MTGIFQVMSEEGMLQLTIEERRRGIYMQPKSYKFYQFRKEEDPLRQSMGALMSFQTLKRVDTSLHDEQIEAILEKLRIW